MARKPHIIANQQRDQRQQTYLAAPELSRKFPAIQEVGVEMRFTDPEGKLTPSPQKRVFMGDMRALFDFLCPLRDCTDGGFPLNAAIHKTLAHPRPESIGTHTCQGLRPRFGEKARTCGLELEYRVSTILAKGRVAA